MIKFTYNNQMEKFSSIYFEYLIYPWDCSPFGYDTGIDFLVQPYDEKQRNKEDNSLYSFEKRFLVQLKSTNEEIMDAKFSKGKLKLDVRHLLSWEKQTDPVMIARYYFKHRCFYYNWIDEIDIKYNNVTQVIHLPYRIDNIQNDANDIIYQETVKENILEKLVPPKIGDLVYVPEILNYGYAELKISRIRNGQQLYELIQDGLLEAIEAEVQAKHTIQSLKSSLVTDSTNILKRFRLTYHYIKLEMFEEAMSELNILIYNFKSVEAKILFSLVRERNYRILNNFKKYNFAYYFMLEGNIPANTKINMIIDETLFDIGAYNKMGILFPKQKFKKIKFSFNNSPIKKDKLAKGIIHKFEIPTNVKLRIYRGLVDKDNKIIDKYSELIIEDKMKISSINIQH